MSPQLCTIDDIISENTITANGTPFAHKTRWPCRQLHRPARLQTERQRIITERILSLNYRYLQQVVPKEKTKDGGKSGANDNTTNKKHPPKNKIKPGQREDHR